MLPNRVLLSNHPPPPPNTFDGFSLHHSTPPSVSTLMGEFQPVIRRWSGENDRWAPARCCQCLVFLCSRCIWHGAQQLAHPGQCCLLSNNSISRGFFVHPKPSFCVFTPQDPAGIFELVEVVGNGTYGQVYKVGWRLSHGLSCFYSEYSGLSVGLGFFLCFFSPHPAPFLGTKEGHYNDISSRCCHQQGLSG